MSGLSQNTKTDEGRRDAGYLRKWSEGRERQRTGILNERSQQLKANAKRKV